MPIDRTEQAVRDIAGAMKQLVRIFDTMNENLVGAVREFRKIYDQEVDLEALEGDVKKLIEIKNSANEVELTEEHCAGCTGQHISEDEFTKRRLEKTD